MYLSTAYHVLKEASTYSMDWTDVQTHSDRLNIVQRTW
jgi:hypothetical protein